MTVTRGFCKEMAIRDEGHTHEHNNSQEWEGRVPMAEHEQQRTDRTVRKECIKGHPTTPAPGFLPNEAHLVRRNISWSVTLSNLP